MLYLKCFEAEVPPEISEKFVGLQSLTPTQCLVYLLDKIIMSEDFGDAAVQCDRILTMARAWGYDVDITPGKGIIVFCEEIMGRTGVSMRMALNEYKTRWLCATDTSAITEYLGVLYRMVAYLQFQIVERAIQWP